jgi:hypothetical protein
MSDHAMRAIFFGEFQFKQAPEPDQFLHLEVHSDALNALLWLNIQHIY